MKAILVVDMPSECIKCPFQAFEYCHPLGKEIPMQNIAICEKPEWCPLLAIKRESPMDNKAVYTDEQEIYQNGYNDGWHGLYDSLVNSEEIRKMVRWKE